MKLKIQASTPEIRNPKNRIQRALLAPSFTIRSMPQAPRTGWIMLDAEFSTIITPTTIMAVLAGLKYRPMRRRSSPSVYWRS